MSEEKPRTSKGPLVSKLADLSKGKIDVTSKSKSLQSSLEALLEIYIAREQSYAEAVKYVQERYDDIIEEAEYEADLLRSAATAKAHKIVATAKEETEAWTIEKAKLAVVQQFQPKVKLDVGGVKCTTSLTTLCRFPDTMIGAMFSGRHALPLDEEGYHFIDRDGTHFRHILNFLRSPESFEIDLTGSSLKELKSECHYYGILELMFPFIPVPEFSISNPWGNMVPVKQDENAIWSVNDVPMNVCIHCFTADYSVCNVYNWGHSGYYMNDFQSTVQSKGGIISPDQPKPPSGCCSCGRSQV